MGRKVRVVHIINSLTFGGAEAMLCNLLTRTDRDRFEPHVVSLIDDLKLAAPILNAGIPLQVMGMRPGLPNPSGPAKLVRHLRRLRPEIVQTWMDHSNLIGGVAARAVPGTKVIWGIHHSHHVRGLTKRSTLLTVWACGKLSSLVPSRIVCCSQHAQKLYVRDGFAADRMLVIPNGFNTELFHPNADARLQIRRELGIDGKAILIGLVARFDPLKDHANFIAAAGLLNKEFADVHFLMCGDGVDNNNAALMGQIAALGIGARCHLLGQRRDVAKIHVSLDIATSSSISEAFPLAVGEAMACGVPCVATDVGDSRMMIGDTGRIVPASESPALAAGWAEMLKMDVLARLRLGTEARRRVRELFDLEAVVRKYEDLYLELVGSEDRLAITRPKVLEASRVA
jgi:glycosyltransferase involved in cell wall biosynthesis